MNPRTSFKIIFWGKWVGDTAKTGETMLVIVERGR
jgi:hypothetical protein